MITAVNSSYKYSIWGQPSWHSAY